MIDTDKLCREFDLLAQAQRDTVLKKSGDYWIGACPFCGGHDRFQVKQKNAVTKFVCRVCLPDKYHDAIEYVMKRNGLDFLDACRLMTAGHLADYETDPARLEELERQRQEQAERDRTERTRRMAEFSDRWIAEEHHARLAQRNYDWWESQGIIRTAVDWWKLGYTPEKHFKHNDLSFTRPAYIIPKYDFGWQPVNVDYRLIDPPEGVGKYRPEYGLPAAPFLSRPDLQTFPDEVFIVEGSKKAMVTTLNSKQKGNPPMVIGVPAKTSWCGVAERVKPCGRVWVILDPDAQHEAHRLAGQIGPAARVITLPFKIDDGFTQHDFSWPDLQKVMRWAN